MQKSIRSSNIALEPTNNLEFDVNKNRFKTPVLRKQPLEDKDRAYLKCRKKITFIQAVILKRGERPENSRFPFFRISRSTTDYLVFQAMSSTLIKSKADFRYKYFIYGKKSLRKIRIMLKKTHLSPEVSDQLFKACGSKIQFIQIKHQGHSVDKLKLLTYLRAISQFSILDTLRLDIGIDSASFSNFTHSQSRFFMYYFSRMRLIKNLEFGKSWPIQNKVCLFIAEVISKLPNLREFHPKLSFLCEKSTLEAEIFKIISESPSLRVLNFLINTFNSRNLNSFALSIPKFNLLRIARAGIHVPEALQTFLMGLSSWENLRELHMECKFGRTVKIELTNFKNISNLVHLRKCVFLFENKRNNQAFTEIWENLGALRVIEDFTLCLKHFKLVDEDVRDIVQAILNWSSLKKLFFKLGEIEYALNKDFYQTFGKVFQQITSDIESIRIRLPYSMKSTPTELLSGIRYPTLRRFEFSGSIASADERGIEALCQVITVNNLKKLRIALNDEKRKKFHPEPPENCHLLFKSFEILILFISRSKLVKLKMIIGRLENKPGMTKCLVDSLHKINTLRCLQLDFGQNQISNSEANYLINWINEGIFRKVTIKGNPKGFNQSIRASLEKLNKRFKKDKEYEEESKIEKLEKYI